MENVAGRLEHAEDALERLEAALQDNLAAAAARREALLREVDCLERLLNISPRTSEIRRWWRSQRVPTDGSTDGSTDITDGNG